MKQLYTKLALMACLLIITFSSCKKEEPVLGDPNSYTTLEISNVKSTNGLIQVDGMIGEKLVTNNTIPKIQITRTDEAGKKAMIYTYTNVNLETGDKGITFKPKSTYGKSTNNVYNFTVIFPAVLLGKGVKGSTTVTLDVFDVSKVVATFNTTNLDYNIKL